MSCAIPWRAARQGVAVARNPSHTLLLLCLVLAWPRVLLATPEAVLSRDAVHPGDFPVCSRHGCDRVHNVTLGEAEWRWVVAPLIGVEDAPSERAALARVIGRMETRVGPRTGTEHDRAGTFPGAGRPGQMDCIDEAVNTTTYLRMLKAAGLLRWHAVETPRTRGYFLFGWPHTAAVIRDVTNASEYAVDAWFEDNGRPAHLVPMDAWRKGWKPTR